MAMIWKLGVLNLSPRLLNFHNPDRIFSDAPSLNSPSGEPPLIPPPRSFSLRSLIQAKLPKFSGFGETGETGFAPGGWTPYIYTSLMLANGAPQWLSVIYPNNLALFMERASIPFQAKNLFILHFRRPNYIVCGTKTAK